MGSSARRLKLRHLLPFLVLSLLLWSASAWASAYPIDQISAINEAQAAALKSAGVENSDQLLEKAATPRAARPWRRRPISNPGAPQVGQDGLFPPHPQRGAEAVSILAAVQVDTSKALLKQEPAKLAEKIRLANEKKKLTEKPPTVESLSAWKDAAQGLPQVLK